MAITTQSELVNALANTGFKLKGVLPSITAVANFSYLGNKATGGSFGTYAVGTAFGSGGEIPTKDTAGFPYFPNSEVGNSRYLAKMTATTPTTGFWDILDCLYRASGFSGAAITEQIISPTAATLTRGRTNGAENEIWVVIDTALGATASNITVKYINQDDVEKTTVARAIGGTQPANRMLKCELADGDYGVKRIVSCTLSASTGTVGAFSLMLARPFFNIGTIVASTGVRLGFNDCGLEKLDDNSALMFVCLATTTSTGIFNINANLIQG